MGEKRPKVAGFITDWLRHDGSRSYGAVGWYRVISPLKQLGYKWYGRTILGGKPEEAMKNAMKMGDKGTIWLYKLVDNPGIHVHIDTAKKFTESKVVIDLDDEPFDFNEAHPLYEKLKAKVPHVKRMILLADHIIVSTESIKQSLLSFKKPITVIPNSIDPAIWNIKKPHSRKDGKIRIGWIGSGSHLADTHIINDAFDEILKKYPQVEIHLAGFVTNASDRGGREFHHAPTAGYEEYPQFLADLDLDIAVAPLMDSKFNRAKSNIKWLEHSMLKTPMVLSDVIPYNQCIQNYKTGYLAKGTAQWVKYLSWLIENEEKRKEIGEAAYADVMKRFTIDKQLPLYEKVFDSVTEKKITVYTAVSGGFDRLLPPYPDASAHYVAFTDVPTDGWQQKEPYKHFTSSRRNSRIQKLIPHLFFNSEYSIYLDGNIRLKVPAQQVIDEFLKEKDVAVFRHIGRDCIYQEAEACRHLGKCDPDDLMEQVKDAVDRGHPKHAGMAECGVIIRRHTKEVDEMGERWWARYCRFSDRDQLSFPLSFDLDKVNLIESSAWRHPWFEMVNHKRK